MNNPEQFFQVFYIGFLPGKTRKKYSLSFILHADQEVITMSNIVVGDTGRRATIQKARCIAAGVADTS